MHSLSLSHTHMHKTQLRSTLSFLQHCARFSKPLFVYFRSFSSFCILSFWPLFLIHSLLCPFSWEFPPLLGQDLRAQTTIISRSGFNIGRAKQRMPCWIPWKWLWDDTVEVNSQGRSVSATVILLSQEASNSRHRYCFSSCSCVPHHAGEGAGSKEPHIQW